MSPILALVLSGLLAYLLGATPFSLIIARRVGGIDLRQHGSGNVGATNVARTLGKKWGLIALLMDATKGMLAVGLLPYAIPATAVWQTHQLVLCAVLAVIGHMFSFWLKFRGGKGVATALGAVLILSPWGTLYAFVAFLLAFLASRIVSLSSMVAAVTFAVAQLALFGATLWTPAAWSLGAFSIGIPALIIFQHRANIGRLLRGEEARFGARKTSVEPSNAELDQTDSPTQHGEH